jgi:EAL domain-containing protein (putative c-di-GMP-specific phosphodiesterase class I)
VLKIDRSFISDLTKNTDSRTIVKAIAAMAHSLEKLTVAEGVESDGQIAILESYGIARVQGFRISKPLGEQELPDFLRLYEFEGNSKLKASA